MSTRSVLARLCLVTLAMFLTAAPARAAATVSLTLAWDPNPEPEVAGYVIRYGRGPGQYEGWVDAGKVTQFTLHGLNERTKYYFVVCAYTSLQVVSDPSVEVSAETRRAYAATRMPDLDGDRRSDPTIWRRSTGMWSWLSSSGGYSDSTARSMQWGNEGLGDVPLAGDVDGDGQGDLVLWRASTGTWFWLTSSTAFAYPSAGSKQWGNHSLGDVPMLADMDGDGASDLLVWRASTGTWYWLTSSTNFDQARPRSVQWGSSAAGDKPFTGDFDGDGRADVAVWRPSDGTWYWLNSSSEYRHAAAGAKQWGNAGLGDVPLVGDFDGDGRSDLTVWRASTGTWYWLTSSSGYAYNSARYVQWGNLALGDQPILADFDGDMKADVSVWRTSSSTWFWLTSSTGYAYSSATGKQFGSAASGDIPIVK